MTTSVKGLGDLARDAIGEAKKRRQISSCLKKNGFLYLGKGAWLGFRNRDIVSGFIIEGSPLDTYISTFILPAFDERKFVSWSLGGRVVHCSLDRGTQEECEQAIASYAADISKINSPAELIRYLDARQVKGHYPIWVRYICYLRLADFDTAIEYLDENKRAKLYAVQIDKYEYLNKLAIAHDKDEVFRVLENWRKSSERIFGPLAQTFSAL